MTARAEKRALVTGASGSLGMHFAKTLAREGIFVVLAGRRMDALNAALDGIKAAGGSGATIQMDVADAASVTTAMQAIHGAYGGLDILINNAGVATTRPFLELSEDDWARVTDVNLTGAWRVARAVAGKMIESDHGGSIIHVASILGLRVAAQVSAYAATKAAVIHLTRVMALELARYSIRVNAIAPGYICTDMNRDFFSTERGKAVVRRIPQRRLGQPDDLDGLLLLLCSDASRYMTGTVIPVDGGHLCSAL